MKCLSDEGSHFKFFLSNVDEGGKFLQAQVLYKLQRYDDARMLYEELLGEVEGDADELMDVLTNYVACLSQLRDADLTTVEKFAAKLPGQKSYELLFNLSLV